MGILGIDNRTENWKTAYTFAPFLEDNVRRRRLAKRLSGAEPPRGEVHIEFFWKGVRDWLHLKGKDEVSYASDFARCYGRLFSNLREDVEKSRLFRKLKDHNYCISSQKEKEDLSRNLKNTEIDIVLESATHFFIGEAKHEMTFSPDGKLNLVHQLVRQYVTAKILIDRVNADGYGKKEVVPFVVGDDAKELLKNHQVQFMRCQGWLRKKNVLSWDEIDRLAGATT